MKVPQNMMKNTSVVLAMSAAVLSAAGLVLALLSYTAFFIFLQGIDSSVSPQMDLASRTSLDARQALLDSAAATGSASGAIRNATLALSSLADSTDGMRSTISQLSQATFIPGSAQLAASAASLQNSSAYFRNASQALSGMSSSTDAASVSLTSLAADLEGASGSIKDAKQGFRDALSMLSLAGLFAAICVCGLFSSTFLLSLSVLLSHYPDFFSDEEGTVGKAAKEGGKP